MRRVLLGSLARTSFSEGVRGRVTGRSVGAGTG
jgi:hypothetical protein